MGTRRTLVGMETKTLAASLGKRVSRDASGHDLDPATEIRQAMERDGRAPAEIERRLARLEGREVRRPDAGYGMRKGAVHW